MLIMYKINKFFCKNFFHKIGKSPSGDVNEVNILARRRKLLDYAIYIFLLLATCHY